MTNPDHASGIVIAVCAIITLLIVILGAVLRINSRFTLMEYRLTNAETNQKETKGEVDKLVVWKESVERKLA